MSRNRAMIVLATIVAFCLVWCGYWAATRPTNGVDVDELSRDISSRVPMGCTPEVVRAWFASRGIPFTDVHVNSVVVGYYAAIPNSSWLENAEIRIEFSFDESMRLLSYSIKRVVAVL